MAFVQPKPTEPSSERAGRGGRSLPPPSGANGGRSQSGGSCTHVGATSVGKKSRWVRGAVGSRGKVESYNAHKGVYTVTFDDIGKDGSAWFRNVPGEDLVLEPEAKR